MKNSSALINKMKFYYCLIVIITLSGTILGQDINYDKFWSTDIELSTLVDSIGRDEVLYETNARLDNAILFFENVDGGYQNDSVVSSWITTIRWAVILEDSQSLNKIESLILSACKGNRLSWQYDFVYTALSGYYYAISKYQTVNEKVEFLINKLDTDNSYIQIFYEDRLMEMDESAVPAVISFARKEIIPHMDNLEKEKLYMEDFAFDDKYYQLVDIIGIMLDHHNDKKQIRALLKEKDPNVQRFARDVLKMESE